MIRMFYAEQALNGIAGLSQGELPRKKYSTRRRSSNPAPNVDKYRSSNIRIGITKACKTYSRTFGVDKLSERLSNRVLQNRVRRQADGNDLPESKSMTCPFNNRRQLIQPLSTVYPKIPVGNFGVE